MRAIITFIILLTISTAIVAFRPAPPPGTPSFIIDSDIEINYAYIDAVVLDTIAQIVFIASLDAQSPIDSIALLPNWPMDSIRLYLSMNIDPADTGILIVAGEKASLLIKDRPLIIRASFETSVRRAITGPPGDWSWGNVIAIYPPFESFNGDKIEIPIFQARLILPPNMHPIASAEIFTTQEMMSGFISWHYSGHEISRAHVFQTK